MILSVVGIMLLKGTTNILAPRQWTMVQNVSDAYLTFEKAFAQRIPFEDLTPESIELPGRRPGGGYVRPPMSEQTFVPQYYP